MAKRTQKTYQSQASRVWRTFEKNGRAGYGTMVGNQRPQSKLLCHISQQTKRRDLLTSKGDVGDKSSFVSFSWSPPQTVYLVRTNLASMMSRFENVVQASRHNRHQLQYIPCGRCFAVIEYDQGAEWSVVNELVNEHWKACPGKLHARTASMMCTPTSPLDTAIALPPPVAPEEGSSSNLVAESVSSPSNTWISEGCERKRRTLEQRKLELEQDEHAKNITTKSVVCGGCYKEISLDKRSKYYPGLWLKHRGKCPSIEKLEVSRV